MSKLYKNYILLKIQNSGKIYLFKCGIFYVFIDSDAEIMSKILNLKLTNLNSLIKKCGFPINSAEKYFKLLQNTDYQVEIVNSNNCSSTDLSNFLIEKKQKSVINDFLKLNIDELSVSQAFECLKKLQDAFKISHISPK